MDRKEREKEGGSCNVMDSKDQDSEMTSSWIKSEGREGQSLGTGDVL